MFWGVTTTTNKIFVRNSFIFCTSWAPRRCPGLFHNFIVKKSRADWSKDPAGFGLGWAPHKKKLYSNLTWGATFVCWPPPNSLPFRGFQRGHYGGYPRGSTFGVAPWLGAEPGWNEEPMPNFTVIGCVGPAAGRRTYTHTHFHLYIGDVAILANPIFNGKKQQFR